MAAAPVKHLTPPCSSTIPSPHFGFAAAPSSSNQLRPCANRLDMARSLITTACLDAHFPSFPVLLHISDAHLQIHRPSKFHMPPLRLSNFLLWQSVYSELYFADVLWPDFKEADYVLALASFQRRQRCFGQRIN